MKGNRETLTALLNFAKERGLMKETFVHVIEEYKKVHN